MKKSDVFHFQEIEIPGGCRAFCRDKIRDTGIITNKILNL